MASEANPLQTTTRNMFCPRCRRESMRRIGRVGFFQRKVLSIFGFYPWECSICRLLKFYRVRGLKKRKKRAAASA